MVAELFVASGRGLVVEQVAVAAAVEATPGAVGRGKQSENERGRGNVKWHGPWRE